LSVKNVETIFKRKEKTKQIKINGMKVKNNINWRQEREGEGGRLREREKEGLREREGVRERVREKEEGRLRER
jgi:hypothetical protein